MSNVEADSGSSKKASSSGHSGHSSHRSHPSDREEGAHVALLLSARTSWRTFLLYGACGVCSFLLSLYLTFPVDAVAALMVQKIADQSAGRIQLTVKKSSLYRFSGVSFSGVELALGGVTVSDGEKAKKPIHFETVTARIHLLPLLMGALVADAEVLMGSAKINLDISPADDKNWQIKSRIQNLELGKLARLLPGLSSGMSLPFSTQVEGTIDATTAGDLRSTISTASLTLSQVSVGPGTVAGFTLSEKIDLGQLDVAFKLRSGRFRIASWQQKGGNFALHAGGAITLRQPIKNSMLDVCIEAKPTADLLAKDDKLKLALELASAARKVKKGPQGALHIPLKGALSRPRVNFALCPKPVKRKGSGKAKKKG